MFELRRKVIAGNWKMNMLPNKAIEFIEGIAPLVKNSEAEIILCVPYTDLFYSLLTAQNTNIKIGAQNMHWEESGAYTGEVSGEMLKSFSSVQGLVRQIRESTGIVARDTTISDLEDRQRALWMRLFKAR